MSFYDRHVLPWLVTKACGGSSIQKQREKVVPLAAGRVLEVGAGGGLNQPFYDKSKVSNVLGLDISAKLLDAAKESAERAGVPFEGVLLDAANIPIEKNEVDTVLVTYSLCSIADLQGALSEMRRVLKPTGKLIFCEHGAAPDPKVLRMQQRLTPVWKKIGGGCHLDRDLPAEIREAGFDIDWLDQMYLPGTWKFVGWNSWGVAKGR